MSKANLTILNIFLNTCASDDTFEKVRGLLSQVMSTDPQWQGMRFRLFRESFTWVGEDSPRAAELFTQIRQVLMQESFEFPELIA